MKKILDNKIVNEKRKKIEKLNQFVGILSGKISEDRVGDIKSKYGR